MFVMCQYNMPLKFIYFMISFTFQYLEIIRSNVLNIQICKLKKKNGWFGVEC